MATVSNINVSPAFHKYFDPVANLKKNLERAFAADQLEIWFMASRPPTREECELGYQWLATGTDDLPMQNVPGNDRPVVLGDIATMRPQSMPVGGVHRLSSSDWAHLRDVLVEQTGSVAHNPSVALSVIPANALSGGNGSLTVSLIDDDNYGTAQHRGVNLNGPLVPWRIRWALLRPRAMDEPAGRMWALMDDHRPGNSGFRQEGDRVLLDFRGGIPLTVGPRGSNANVRIGRTWLDNPRTQHKVRVSTYYYVTRLAQVEMFSLHIPLPTVLGSPA